MTFWPTKMAEQREEGKSMAAAAATAGNVVKRSHLFPPLKSMEVNMCKNKPSSVHGSLSTTDFILSKVFRKDGPPLGSEFDSLPFLPSHSSYGPSKMYCIPQENHRALKKRKVDRLSKHEAIDSDGKGPSVKKHGIGKGLMTLWNSINPDGKKYFPRFKCLDAISQLSKPHIYERKRQPKRLLNKGNGKKKPQVKKKENKKKERGSQFASTEQCGLAIIGGTCTREFDLYSELVDDEEIELREIQDAKFPPDSVKMKQPFSIQPWASSQKLVKKLFKVFHFWYTCASVLNLFPFTLDEFAEAFLVKDSMLLCQIHMTLLKSLLSSIEMELRCGGGCPSQAVQGVMFLGFLHKIQRKEFVVKLWIKGLNSLTWVEIMRQILVAAGFGTREDTLEKQIHNKEVDIIVKYGLNPGTLKFAIFSVLMEHGNNGLDVSELEHILQGADLNLSSTNDELGAYINSTLASDITLFEKISSSAYRLRVAIETCVNQNPPCDSDEPETVDYDGRDGCMVGHLSPKTNMLPPHNEIDESNQNEGWLVGVTDGEYSDLSVEEKLDALLALIALLSTQFTMKEPVNSIVPFGHSEYYNGYGATIKGSTKENPSKNKSSVHVSHTRCKDANTSSEFQSLDSSILASQFDENGVSNLETDACPHPMQSVFLGFDRRYNKYWLFLGPCYPNDPGHRQIYFESSEDGHWEVIDCKETLHCLLSVLDGRGRREAQLEESLLKRESILCRAMSMVSNDVGLEMTQCNHPENVIIRENSASPVSDVDNNVCPGNTLQISLVSGGSNVCGVHRKGGREEEWNRSQEFDVWMWSSFYCNLSVVKHGKRSYLDSLMRCVSCRDLYWRDEKHCKNCHSTFEVDFDLEERYTIHTATCRQTSDDGVFPKHKVFPSQLQSLKAAIYAIESVIPKEAMTTSWTKSSHNLWIKRLRRIASIYELFQVLTDFVTAIDLDWLDRSNIMVGSGCIVDEIISCFFTMPRTSSSVALWLVKLDNLIDPYLVPPPPCF